MARSDVAPHMHLDGAEFFKFLIMLILAGAFLRIMEALFKNTIIGQALVAVY